jgi:hypothetical protein
MMQHICAKKADTKRIITDALLTKYTQFVLCQKCWEKVEGFQGEKASFSVNHTGL